MESVDFAPGFEIIFRLLSVILIVIGIAIKLASVYFLTATLSPYTAKLFKFENRLTGISRYDFFSFQFTWIMITPAVLGLLHFIFMIFSRARIMDFSHEIGNMNIPFDLLQIYLFGLTLWFFDSNLAKFKLKPLNKNLLNALMFVGLYLVFSLFLLGFTEILGSYSRNFLNKVFYGFCYSILYPCANIALAYFLIRKNMIQAQPSE